MDCKFSSTYKEFMLNSEYVIMIGHLKDTSAVDPIRNAKTVIQAVIERGNAY